VRVELISGKNDTGVPAKWLTSITKGEWGHCQTAIWRCDAAGKLPLNDMKFDLLWKEMYTAQPPGNAALTKEVILAARGAPTGGIKDVLEQFKTRVGCQKMKAHPTREVRREQEYKSDCDAGQSHVRDDCEIWQWLEKAIELTVLLCGRQCGTLDGGAFGSSVGSECPGRS
jgi:hypothetical protein